MALVLVTSVANRFLMIWPFLLSMVDQWYTVMTETPLFLMPSGYYDRIYYSVTALLIYYEFINFIFFAQVIS